MELKNAARVIGYFAHESGGVFCDGDACIIAGSEELMRNYLKAANDTTKYIIQKTRFGEVVDGLMRGGAYAFDKVSYSKFFTLAQLNQFDKRGLPPRDAFSNCDEPLHFIRFQCVG